jgi:ubiquinone/menaquinone biosynthesis C-methylase UbiE
MALRVEGNDGHGAHKSQIIDKWFDSGSADWKYFDAVENQVGSFWQEGGLFMTMFSRLRLDYVVEIACGKGRHSAQIVDKCGALILVDTSPDAIEYVKTRFQSNPNVTPLVSPDGESLPFVPANSTTAVFSYDAMVHFEPITVYHYLQEINRILVPGGQALLHYSNYSKMPASPFNESPGWRNYMTADLFAHFAHRSGLQIVDTRTIDWADTESDALTLVAKPSA